MFATAHQQSRMEREEGQVRVVLYFTWTRVGGVVWHIASPLQMMTAVEETGGGASPSELVTGVTTRRCPLQMMTAVEETGGYVPLSELVTGVTTRQCCRWVSPHTTHTSTHTHTVGGEVGYTTQHCQNCSCY